MAWSGLPPRERERECANPDQWVVGVRKPSHKFRSSFVMRSGGFESAGAAFFDESGELVVTGVLGPAGRGRVPLGVPDRRVGTAGEQHLHQYLVTGEHRFVQRRAAVVGGGHTGVTTGGIDVEADVEHEADRVVAPERGRL